MPGRRPGSLPGIPLRTVKRIRRDREKGVQGPKKRENDLDARWKGLIVKTRKRRRVAARCRGWERKKAGAGLGFGLGFA